MSSLSGKVTYFPRAWPRPTLRAAPSPTFTGFSTTRTWSYAASNSRAISTERSGDASMTTMISWETSWSTRLFRQSSRYLSTP
jgi:hypothetical protein